MSDAKKWVSPDDVVIFEVTHPEGDSLDSWLPDILDDAGYEGAEYAMVHDANGGPADYCQLTVLRRDLLEWERAIAGNGCDMHIQITARDGHFLSLEKLNKREH